MEKYTWELANEDSTIHFKLKYLQISNITGSFLRFTGTITADEPFSNPEVHLRIEASSVETLDPKWNTILTAEEALSAKQFPVLTFDAVDGCRRSSGSIWELTGQLGFKGRQQSLTMVVNYSQVKRVKGLPMAQFQLFGEFSLEDFGWESLRQYHIGNKLGLYVQVVLLRMP